MKNLVLAGLFVVVSLLVCIGIGYTASLDGNTSNSWGYGVRGYAAARSGTTIGVYGLSYSPQGYGVIGQNAAWSGAGIGIWGISLSSTGTAIKGITFSQRGLAYGVVGESRSPRGIGVLGINHASSGNAVAVKGTTNSSEGYPGYFEGGQGIKIPVRDTDPVNPAEGTIWINSKETALKMRLNGTTFALKPLTHKNPCCTGEIEMWFDKDYGFMELWNEENGLRWFLEGDKL